MSFMRWGHEIDDFLNNLFLAFANACLSPTRPFLLYLLALFEKTDKYLLKNGSLSPKGTFARWDLCLRIVDGFEFDATAGRTSVLSVGI